MRIGITGAVGFLGANVVRYFHEVLAEKEKSIEIVPFCSSQIHNPLTDRFALAYEHLDIGDRQAVFEKTRNLDALFHVAGTIEYRKRYSRRCWDINVLGSKNIFDAVLENRIGRLVYVSSINVLGAGKKRGDLIDESASVYDHPHVNPNSFASEAEALVAVSDSLGGDYRFLKRVLVPYFDAKLAGYELARDYHRNKGLPVILMLPGTIVGAGDIHFAISDLVSSVYHSRLPFTFSGGTSFVSSFDAGKGLWLTFDKGRIGESYIISGNETENLRYAEFMRLVAEVVRENYGKWCLNRFLSLPPSLARTVANALEWLNSDSPLSLGLALAGSVVHCYSIQKAHRELGYSPSVELRSAIRENLEFVLRK